MSTSDILAIAAILVSLFSLGLSAYLAWKDRAIVSAESHARRNEQTGEYASVFIRVVNKGRRLVILRYLWGTYTDGSKSGMELADSGIHLRENEFHELEFGKFDGVMINDHDGAGGIPDLISVAFEDTRGKTYPVKDSARNVALIRSSEHRFGIRTHG